jgi:hypothetical protein
VTPEEIARHYPRSITFLCTMVTVGVLLDLYQLVSG